jgi:hypothetical protein
MDCQPTDSSLWLGANPSRSDPRSGCLLRQPIRSSRSLTRHSRSSNVCTLALAERVCGAPDRLDPPGMPGPHRGDRRAAPAPYPQMLHGVLQRGAHASIVRQGCAHLEGHPVRRAHRSAVCAWWTAPSVGADLICGRDSQRDPLLTVTFNQVPLHARGRGRTNSTRMQSRHSRSARPLRVCTSGRRFLIQKTAQRRRFSPALSIGSTRSACASAR